VVAEGQTATVVVTRATAKQTYTVPAEGDGASAYAKAQE
jgi:hypothetical protein